MHHVLPTLGVPQTYLANHREESMHALIYGGDYVTDGLGTQTHDPGT
jgi:hypothetical protein